MYDLNADFGTNVSGIIVYLIAIAIAIALLVVVGKMASNRNRSVAGWVCLSLFCTTPVVVIIILACIGDAYPQGPQYKSKPGNHPQGLLQNTEDPGVDSTVCPSCAGKIPKGQISCPSCGHYVK